MSRTLLIAILVVGGLGPVRLATAGEEAVLTNTSSAGVALPDNMPPRLRERVAKLSPAERQKIVERWQQLRDLPPEARKMVNRNYQKFRNMTPEQREELKQRLQQWQSMSPEDKKRLQENFERWKKLTPQEREELRKNRNRRPNTEGQTPTGGSSKPVGKTVPTSAN